VTLGSRARSMLPLHQYPMCPGFYLWETWKATAVICPSSKGSVLVVGRHLGPFWSVL
jgi:hypothetical protein